MTKAVCRIAGCLIVFDSLLGVKKTILSVEGLFHAIYIILFHVQRNKTHAQAEAMAGGTVSAGS